jgi:outer membrane protein OmpA-like peptidoglycan-associated protein
MSTSSCVRRAAVAARLLVVVLAASGAGVAAADEPPPTVIDSQTIVRSLKASAEVSARGLVVAPAAHLAAAGSEPGAGSGKITLDIRFASDSDRLTAAAQGQLAQLGQALASPDLGRARFLIAGHTSASGSADHNQRLSQARAQAVRQYLLEHFAIAPARIEAAGYGSSRPLPNFAPNALQQRRVEIITLPPSS